MPAASANLLIDQGATFSATLKIVANTNVPIDLTGYTARASVRKNYSDDDALADFTVTIQSPATDGVLVMGLTATETAALSAVNGVYDVEIVSGSGVVTRVLQGKATISPEATK